MVLGKAERKGAELIGKRRVEKSVRREKSNKRGERKPIGFMVSRL